MNRRLVLAARRIGRDHAGLKKFCTVMDLPRPVSKSNFHNHQVELEKAASVVAENSRNAAAQSLIKSDGSGEVAVTFDGTCQRRDFSSLNGAFTAISWTSGMSINKCAQPTLPDPLPAWRAKQPAYCGADRWRRESFGTRRI